MTWALVLLNGISHGHAMGITDDSESGVAILARTYADPLTEDFRKLERVLISGQRGYLSDIMLGFMEQLLRFFQAALQQKISK